MARVFIPPSMRKVTDGDDCVSVAAATIREAIDELEARFPGFRDRVCVDGDIKPSLAVSIDGNVSSLGLHQRIGDDTEVHFLPAIGGG